MNAVQQLALLYVMKMENKDSADLEWERFKMNMVAHHPAQAKEIINLLDKRKAPEVAVEVPVTEDGYSAEETGFILGELRKFGFAVTS